MLTTLYAFFTCKLAPDYKGVTLNIGLNTLFKTLVQEVGADGKKVKEIFQKTGDIGIVAE